MSTGSQILISIWETKPRALGWMDSFTMLVLVFPFASSTHLLAFKPFPYYPRDSPAGMLVLCGLIMRESVVV